jgi:hypothetical protein
METFLYSFYLYLYVFQLQNSEDQLRNVESKLSTFLRHDQVYRLQMKNSSSSRSIKWSTETIQHALSVRTAVVEMDMNICAR